MHPTTQQIRDAIARATDGLSENQMREHPEGKWDTAAILEHLAMTYSSTARVMQKVMTTGKPLATSPTFKHRAGQFLVLTCSYVPTGRKAPKQVVPTQTLTGKEACELIFTTLEKMDEALAQCEHRFGNKVKIADHAVLGPVPISGWRKFALVHTRHHMKQIEALKRTYPEAKATAATQSK